MIPFDPQSAPGGAPLRGDIAIVGMGCLFAGAANLDDYWRNIVSKVDAISDPPPDEWDPKLFYDPESKSNDRVYCKRGGYIGALSQFRPLDFGIMPVTVDGGEPDQWLALRVAQEALADAGYAGAPKEHVRTEVILGKGTYVNRGNLTVGYHAMLVEYFLQALKNLHPEYTDAELQEIKKEMKAGLPPFSADIAPALIGNIIAGRIANRLDFMGPSFTVDAACASALLAIEIGVRDLLSCKCDLVLAGGANVNVPLPTVSLFCQLGALSRREQIRPFDRSADGTLLGGGLGMIVLKRREDAERDGSRIYAIIKGVGLASDGRAVHVMAPRVEGEELALRRAYEMAEVSPDTIGLIEAHGTATPLGDAVELEALTRVFGQRRGVLPDCALGSVKSMIGHTMPAAGIAGVIKAALALYHRVLPPTLNCEEPNPALHLDQTRFYVNTETRPWIHGEGTPRRAGVNSFGFGGINGHVVLEEHGSQTAQQHSHQPRWDTEVFLLEAESRQALIKRAGRLNEYLAGTDEVSLKDLAYTLNTRLENKKFRLAVVAASQQELTQKLTLALGRLADPRCRQIKDNGGVYFFEEPLDGKLAFLFPGEGAQYPNMLLDLCLHFPEVRNCFDVADRALMHGSRKILPSDFIFPRSILSASERSVVEEALWQIDGAVESVLIGNWAMGTLLDRLAIRPDVIVGHSTGDYSAMLASRIINLTDEAYVGRIVEWNKAHAQLAQQMTIPQVTLVAVAADSATVTSVTKAVAGDLYLAMDNCPHQTVLAGSKAAAAQAIEQFRARGIIYEILPFDRPYHTPMFQAYADGAGEEVFAHLPIAPPRIETYSCTTAAPYPQEIEEIRKLFVAHWVRPVLFADTIKRMYDDGARIFVEAGPRGNLTAFVSDILRGRPHLAMPANVARRSGLTQINHLAGILAAQGVPMRLDYLYARRDPQIISWEEMRPAGSGKRPAAPMNVALALPPLKISPRKPKPVPAEGLTSSAPPRNSSVPEFPSHQAAAATAVAPAGGPALLMQEYFKGMETFLETECQVMGAFLNRLRMANGGSGVAHSPEPRNFPLLGTITALTPGEELVAVRPLSLHEDLFLRDHALGGPVSVTDPELRPLIVLPLAMSMEILAEAATVLMPGLFLVGMRDIQAYRWIQVDDAPLNLQISARRMPGSRNEVAVQIRNLADGSAQKAPAPVIEGIMIFGESYPVPPPASAGAFEAERPSQLASTPLYGRLMFHGPSFQGVANVDRSGQNGNLAQLLTLAPRNLFRSTTDPQFVIDPVLLDAAGQLVGFWAAEYLTRGFVVFPYHLEKLHIYGPNRPAGERLACRATLQLNGNEGIRSDIEILGPNGLLWLQLQGWADRRFDPPARFHRAWVAPREATISEPWPALQAGFSGKEPVEAFRLELPFRSGAGLWKELWASLILTRRERQAFGPHLGSERHQLEWLNARTAAKDAVRGFLRKQYGLDLLPADIEISEDEHGDLVAGGAWSQHVRSVPRVSVTHTEDLAVAVAGSGGANRRIALHLESIRVQPEGETLGEGERRFLNLVPPSARAEWLVRLGCVKEAVAKAVGRDGPGGRSSVKILALHPETGAVSATANGRINEAGRHAPGAELLSFTAREGDYAVAIAIHEERTS